MTEDRKDENKSGGGMYRGVNVSVKVLDIVIGLGIMAITMLVFIGKV